MGPSVNRSFVVDTSVAVGWVHPAQATKETDAMYDSLGEGVVIEVPALWPLEVANALLVLVRRGRMTERDRDAALGWLRQMPARIDQEMAGLGFTKLPELASEHNLSVYDAAYLELAQRRRLTLGCKDGPLREAAKRAGVTLWT